MKKILYLIAAIGVTWGVVSCDNEPKNPGNFKLKSEVELSDMVSVMTGEVFKLEEVRAIDTVFKTYVIKWDSIFDDGGVFLKTEADTVWMESKHKTKYREFAPIELPAAADSIKVEIGSNAKWNCTFSGSWTTVTDQYNHGGGDGTILFTTTRNRNVTRKTYSNMEISSSDSTVWLVIPLGQKGERD